MGSDREFTAGEIDTKAIDAAVRKMMKTADAPGAAIAVLRGDDVYIQAYGVKRVGETDPVTVDTLFANASTTKAFTTATVALLVDEKKMEWDDPVSKHLPSFRLSDPHADVLVTVRDLVCHRTGMPRHDWLWYRSGYDRDEMLRRFSRARPTAPFRSLYQYNNICFTAAGEVVRAVSGAPSWEAFLKERLLTPLGMTRTNSSTHDAEADPNHAEPHKKIKNKVVTTPYLNFDNVGACGTLNSSAREMVNWLRLHLSGGLLPDGTRLLSEAALRETYVPQMPIRMDDSTRERYPFITQMSYGLGWSVWNYRNGYGLLSHGGAIDGFRSHVVLVPSEKIAVAIFVNLGQPFVEPLRNSLLDLLLGLPPMDWHATLKTDLAKMAADAKKAEVERREKRKSRKPLPIPLEKFVGTYTEPAYGTLTVTRADDKRLRIAWNTFDLPLDHLTYTTFVGVIDTLTDDKTEVKFEVDAAGKVARVRFLDGEFTRDAPPSPPATA